MADSPHSPSGPSGPGGVPGSGAPGPGPGPGPDVELTTEFVPAFVLTGGSVLPADEEFTRTTWVTVTEPGLSARIVVPEARQMRDLLGRGPLSVHEVTARVNVPLGVGRVLLAQLRDSGVITARPPIPRAQKPDRALLTDILNGLKAKLGA
jgi:hypothetical protein